MAADDADDIIDKLGTLLDLRRLEKSAVEKENKRNDTNVSAGVRRELMRDIRKISGQLQSSERLSVNTTCGRLSIIALR